MLSRDDLDDDTRAIRELRAKVAGHASWAQTRDRTARTAPARAALERKFLEAAGGDPQIAASLRSEHYARLALKSAMARRAKKRAEA